MIVSEVIKYPIKCIVFIISGDIHIHLLEFCKLIIVQILHNMVLLSSVIFLMPYPHKFYVEIIHVLVYCLNFGNSSPPPDLLHRVVGGNQWTISIPRPR